MTPQELLYKFLERFDFLQAIVLTDKDCIEIFGAYVPDSDLRENAAAMMFCTALTQTNENLQKVYQTKARAVTLFYEEYIVYVENWNNISLSIFAKQRANVGLLYELASDLKDSFIQLSDILEKIK